MSKKTYRKDKTCLNCNHVVAEHFCPNCGQENIDTRKTFHHLFIHFFEDLTHYENAFWRTIKNLLFKPASLTKEYLSGKRLSYLAPVRLYIFISFITFFMFAVFSSNFGNSIKINESKSETNSISSKQLNKEAIVLEKLKKEGKINANVSDSIGKIIKESEKTDLFKNKDFINIGYKSVKEMDSIRKVNPSKISEFEYWITKKGLNIITHNTKDEIIEKWKESALHNFPKVLLIYMPLFAFFLWLFQNKKRWYFFDHGIFTLHYFSFLLLMSLILFLLQESQTWLLNNDSGQIIINILNFIGFCWMFYYFFPAHHRFYEESRWTSFFKSMLLFFINMFFISVILTLFFVYTLVNIH